MSAMSVECPCALAVQQTEMVYIKDEDPQGNSGHNQIFCGDLFTKENGRSR